MGYYTRYDFSVVGGGDDKTDYKEELVKRLPYDYFDCQITWVNWSRDLMNFSKEYPDVLFLLSGEGEENADLWRAYFRNGKMQLCEAKITYDNFDENKLT